MSAAISIAFFARRAAETGGDCLTQLRSRKGRSFCVGLPGRLVPIFNEIISATQPAFGRDRLRLPCGFRDMFDRNGINDVPIACSLTSSEARERVERWRKLVRDARTASVMGDGYVEASFRNEPAFRLELEALVAAERECCGFLHFDLRETRARLILTIAAEREEARHDLTLLISSLGIA